MRKHLYRRWHAHPIAADLLKLAPHTIVRSNWLLYLKEARQFAHGLSFAVGCDNLLLIGKDCRISNTIICKLVVGFMSLVSRTPDLVKLDYYRL